MHYIAVCLISPQNIGYDLTKRVRIQTLIEIFDSPVNIFFFRGNTTLVILGVETHASSCLSGAKLIKELKKNPPSKDGGLIEPIIYQTQN